MLQWNLLVRRLDFCVKRLCNTVMKTKRVAIYVRVSTIEQDTDSQEAELREYVECPERDLRNLPG